MCRDWPVRRVLLSHPVHAGDLGILRAEDRRRLPAADRRRARHLRWRFPADPQIGARPLLLAGSAISTGGLYWLSRIGEHATYIGGLPGPIQVAGAGFGLLFVPLALVALSRVAEADSGVASSLLNTGQQVGGSIGLAVLGTVAWTVVANSVHAQALLPGRPVPVAVYHHALATGFGRGFLVSAGMLLTLSITIAAIRVGRTDLAGVQQPRAAGTPEQAERR